jgi:predicted nucleic acid-binding protein
MLVVDASIALAWCFADEASPLADSALQRLGSEETVAPALWAFEVANGLLSAERRGRIGAEELPKLHQLLSALPIRLESLSLSDVLGDVRELARSLGLSVYDASYLALALRRGAILATADVRLRAASERAGIEVLR